MRRHDDDNLSDDWRYGIDWHIDYQALISRLQSSTIREKPIICAFAYRSEGLSLMVVSCVCLYLSTRSAGIQVLSAIKRAP